MRKSSITLQHNKDIRVNYFYHNSREKPTSNSIFSDDNNFTNRTAVETLKKFWNEFNIRKEKYEKEKKKKLPKNTIKHISAIFNTDEHTKREDIQKVIEHLEKTLDTKIIQYSIHNDEGHIDENGNKKVNYHVHLEMIGIDSNGRSIRKKIDRKYLRDLQTEVSKILKMERGQDVRKTRRKRLNTYEYKIHKQLENKEEGKIRNELKKRLEDTEKDEKEKRILIQKNNELENENENMKKENNKEQQKQLEQQKKIKELNEKLTQEKEKYENDIEVLKNKNNEQNKEIEQLKEENKELKEKVNYEKNKLKKLREIMILINKEIKLYNKEDYKEISNIKKELKNVLDLKIITEINNNIDKLINHFKVKLNEQKETTQKLYDYLEQLENQKNNNQQKRNLSIKL